MKFKYTVCFLKQGNRILMLNREKAPIMGIWNGVGGKIEGDESPVQAALREVWEETGIRLNHFFSEGVVKWTTSNGSVDGIHVFLAVIDQSLDYPTPIKTREGILDWKKIDWILDSNNLGIPEKVPHYLPLLINDEGYHDFHYEAGGPDMKKARVENE
ncbi:NUDIX hydrolase [Bacillus cihuensis]|uniref:NUDIX hydrolase n=1 Tax=Bacillus cihuensis TaxID=1208599 RepID=UPI000A059150|nr:8-oxo-dGTP diphosphatase [Bacillus cihuensis]